MAEDLCFKELFSYLSNTLENSECEKIIKNLQKSFQKKEIIKGYKQLNKLQIFISEYKKNEIDIEKKEMLDKCMNRLYETLLNIGIHSIKNNELSNIDLLKFISFNKDNEKIFKCTEYIDFNSIDNRFYEIFNKENEEFKNKFVNNLFNDINKKRKISLNDYIQVMGSLLQLISYTNDSENLSNTLIQHIHNSSTDSSEQIVLTILKKFEFNETIIDQLINVLEIPKLSNDIVLDYLSQFPNKIHIQNMIFKYLMNRVVKNKCEIINAEKELSENVSLLLELINKKYFDGSKYDNEYIKNSNKNMKEIYDNLSSFDFSIEELKLMDSINNNERNDDLDLKARCSIICLKSEKHTNNLYNLLNKKITHCLSTLDKLNGIIKIFSKYFPKDHKELTNYYINLRDNVILKKPISDFPKNIKEFKPSLKVASEIENLVLIKLFTEILNQIKSLNGEKRDTEIIEEAKSYINKLVRFLGGESENQLKINYKFMESVLKKMKVKELDLDIKKLLMMYKIPSDDDTINKNGIKLKMLKNRALTIELFKKILLLLDDFQANNGNNFLKEEILNEIKLLERSRSLSDLMAIYEGFKQLNLNLNILDSSSSIVYSVIDNMYSEPGFVQLILNKTPEDFKQMSELIDEASEISMKREDIPYIEKCALFIHEFKEKCINKSDHQIVEDLINFIQSKKYDNIGECFEKSSKCYHDLNKLNIYYLNPNALDREHLKSLLLKSVLVLKFTDSGYECTADYDIIIKKKKSSESDFNEESLHCHENFEELERLRDVALVEDSDQNFEPFVNIIDNISQMIQLLKDIFYNGYYKTISYEIVIIDSKTYLRHPKTKGLKLSDLNKTIKELKIIKNDQEREILQTYETNTLTQLIYGSQFNLINKIIHGEVNTNEDDKEEDDKAEDDKEEENLSTERKFNNILKFITGHRVRNYHPYEMNLSKETTSLKQMFGDINSYLNQISMNHEFNLEMIYKDAELKNKNHSGIFSFACPLEDVEVNSIYSALHLTGHFPLAQTVLYCNDYTSKEEILSFIYRAIKCDYPVLFMVLKPENLNIRVKQFLIELLTEKFSSQDLQDMISCLLFIYSKENEALNIIMEIQKLINHKDFRLSEDCISTKIFPNVVYYSSDYSGLGKSTKIKRDFENELNTGYDYIYFPIGGDVNKHDIMERLLKKLTNKKVELHLDLLETSNIELMKEFLFSFLILKYYSHNNTIFCYQDEIKVKIEISNGFSDCENTFSVFRFFKNEHISIKNLPGLYISNEEESLDIQIVCNYIKYLDIIDTKDLYFPGLNDETKNSQPAQVLSEEECFGIILETIGNTNFNFYKLQIFIKILSNQLRSFSKSIYFNTMILNEAKMIRRNLNKARSTFITSLINYVCYFINSFSGKNIEEEQKLTMSHHHKNFNYEKAIQEANRYLAQKEPFSIGNLNLGMIFFNEDGYSISILRTCDKNSQEYQILNAIYNSNALDKDIKDLNGFKNLTTQEYLKEVRKVLNLNIPINEQELMGKNHIRRNSIGKNNDNKELRERKYLEDIVKSYVFTEDNFIKLILISLRLRTHVPVIMLGECGCGKTSLIRMIAKLKGIKMYINNIHSGTEDKDIEQFLKEKNLFATNSEHESKEEIWVFFDEINTCHSMGLIAEIMLKHTCRGERIKENIKFIGACNPYRLNTQKDLIIGLYDKERHSPRELVYTVYPIPNCLNFFIFDCGTPEESDIKKYIYSMVSHVFEDLNVNVNVNRHEEEKNKNISFLIRLSVNTIFTAHKFIKDHFDISAVSLREIRRWEILFKWFIDFLKMPYINKKLNIGSNETNQNICVWALNLSLYICYYVRIFLKSKRNEFLSLMQRDDNFGNQFDFEKYPKKVQHMIADEVHLKKGIAKNKLLLENLFSVFVCINSKIPLVMVGRPGCSKTLSTQCIFESMNGKDSTSEFFRLFPKLYTVSYQGSLTSTPSEVKKLFERARDSLKNKKFSEKVIMVIFFDEMGLAEISEHNPLKAIHSELDFYDDDDDNDDREKIGFIGISNWALDASKMNRVIHLSIPEPDLEDLITTSLTIAQSYDERLQFYSKAYKHLSMAYYHYLKTLEENSVTPKNELDNEFDDDYSSIKQFHGTRDFYSMIKKFSELLIANDFPESNPKIKEIMNESIARNFGGLLHSVSLFNDHLENIKISLRNMDTPNVMECIEKNINDFNSRFLLVITNNSMSHFLISLLLSQSNKNYEFYYGSNFKEDNALNHYSAKILNKVKSSMIHENIIVFNNLTNLYPSLNDLFNQNYRTINKNKYARIALGSSNVQNYLVNDKIRFIIFLDYNEVKKQDPPFLNRFEKQILLMKNLLTETEIEVSKNIYELLKRIVNCGPDELKLDLSYEFINCGLEEIQAITYKLSNNFANNCIEDNDVEPTDINRSTEDSDVEDTDINRSTEDNDVEPKDISRSRDDTEMLSYEDLLSQQVLETIVPTFSQDLILYMRDSSFSKKYEKEYQTILNVYLKEKILHQNIKNYLEHMNTNKHIIYTYSNIYDSLFGYRDEIKQFTNDHFGCSFTRKTVKNIYVNNYKSEREMDEVISDYLTNTNLNLGIVHFGINDIDHLIHINYLVENNENQLKTRGKFQSKIIIFMIHLKRKMTNIDPEEEKAFDKLHQGRLISHLSEWKQFFIDNLNRYDISFEKLLMSPSINLFYENKNLMDSDEKFNEILQQSLDLLTYNIKTNLDSNYFLNTLYSISPNYKSMAYDYISSDRELKHIISDLVIEKMRNQNEILATNILKDYEFKDSDVDFISITNNYGVTIFRSVLVKIMAQLEKYNIFSSKLLCGRALDNKLLYKIIPRIIEKGNTRDFLVSSQPLPENVDLIMGMTYPCISLLFDEIAKNKNKYYFFLNERKLREGKISLEKFSENKTIYVANFKDDFLRHYEEIYLTPLLRNNETDGESALINNTNQKALLKSLLTDYIRFFLSQSDETFEDPTILKFFNILYKLFVWRNDANRDTPMYSIENITEFILFTESYEHLIYDICKFIIYMNEYEKSFLNTLISLLPMNLFKTEYNELSIVNDIFINLFESILYNIINNDPSFEDNDEEICISYIEGIIDFTKVVKKMSSLLNLRMPLLHFLMGHISILNTLIANKIPSLQLKKFLQLLKKESNLYILPFYESISKKDNLSLERNVILFFNLLKIKNENHSREAPEVIHEEYEFLIDVFSSNPYCIEFILDMLMSKLEIYKNDDDIKKIILGIICSNELLIQKEKTQIIFESIFNGQLIPNINENNIIKYLNTVDNVYLNDILCDLFQKKLKRFFELNIQNNDLLINKEYLNILNLRNSPTMENNKFAFKYCMMFKNLYNSYMNNKNNNENNNTTNTININSFNSINNDKSNNNILVNSTKNSIKMDEHYNLNSSKSTKYEDVSSNYLENSKSKDIISKHLENSESDDIISNHLENSEFKDNILPIYTENNEIKDNILPIYTETNEIKDNILPVYTENSEFKDNILPIYTENNEFNDIITNSLENNGKSINVLYDDSEDSDNDDDNASTSSEDCDNDDDNASTSLEDSNNDDNNSSSSSKNFKSTDIILNLCRNRINNFWKSSFNNNIYF